MKRTIICFALFLLVGAAANAQVCTIVSIGSADVNYNNSYPPNNDANLSLIAIEKCNGTVRGRLQDTWGNHISIHVDVDCLVVDGNDAWVSGVITKVTPTALYDGFGGLPVALRLQDNGQFKDDPPDKASIINILGFSGEYHDCSEKWDYELYDLVNGQAQIIER